LTLFHLQGATGNQLFCLFAGISYENNSKLRVSFDESYLKPKKLQHPGGLRDIELRFKGIYYEIELRRSRSSLLKIYLDRIVYKIFKEVPILRHFTRQHRSKVYGFDPELNLSTRYKKIIGFFQTYVYVDQVTNSLGKLEIVVKEPSEWFNSYSRELSGLEKSVSIHIRRGDYAQNADGIGMLDIKYFYNSLHHLEQLHTIDKAYIFSDSFIDLNGFREKFPRIEFTFLDAPAESAPIESIILMSLTTFRLISNSSYSWWSAYLATDPNSNFAPEPWFRNKDIPQKLIPDSWVKLDAIWTDGIAK
jgi:hypothetical protein